MTIRHRPDFCQAPASQITLGFFACHSAVSRGTLEEPIAAYLQSLSYSDTGRARLFTSCRSGVLSFSGHFLRSLPNVPYFALSHWHPLNRRARDNMQSSRLLDMPTTSIELHARPGTASTTHSAASTHNAAEISDPNADTKLPTRRYQVLLLFSGFMMIFQIIGINSVFGRNALFGDSGSNVQSRRSGSPGC